MLSISQFTTHYTYTVWRLFLWQLKATSLLYSVQPQTSWATHSSVKLKPHWNQITLVIFTFHNQFMFPSCLNFPVSQGEICWRSHLAQRQLRESCIHHSRTSLCGFCCHFRSVLYEWCLPSGATHAGEYILPGHWKENLTSAMLILAVMSSSICGNKEHWVRCHF